MVMVSEVYEQLLRCPTVPPETGGILGMTNNVVCECFFDTPTLQTDRAVYIPHIELLNKQISQWQLDHIRFIGMFHSHPVDQPSLSADDKQYIQTICRAVLQTADHLYFPVVLPGIKVCSFKAIRRECNIDILEDIITVI